MVRLLLFTERKDFECGAKNRPHSVIFLPVINRLSRSASGPTAGTGAGAPVREIVDSAKRIFMESEMKKERKTIAKSCLAMCVPIGLLAMSSVAQATSVQVTASLAQGRLTSLLDQTSGSPAVEKSVRGGELLLDVSTVTATPGSPATPTLDALFGPGGYPNTMQFADYAWCMEPSESVDSGPSLVHLEPGGVGSMRLCSAPALP